MAIYEYECTECGSTHEHIMMTSDPTERTCPVCGGQSHKVISLSNFKLKGSGWYKDGYSSQKD